MMWRPWYGIGNTNVYHATDSYPAHRTIHCTITSILYTGFHYLQSYLEVGKRNVIFAFQNTTRLQTRCIALRITKFWNAEKTEKSRKMQTKCRRYKKSLLVGKIGRWIVARGPPTPNLVCVCARGIVISVSEAFTGPSSLLKGDFD